MFIAFDVQNAIERLNAGKITIGQYKSIIKELLEAERKLGGSIERLKGFIEGMEAALKFKGY